MNWIRIYRCGNKDDCSISAAYVDIDQQSRLSDSIYHIMTSTAGSEFKLESRESKVFLIENLSQLLNITESGKILMLTLPSGVLQQVLLDLSMSNPDLACGAEFRPGNRHCMKHICLTLFSHCLKALERQYT
jgi:hypothetical protein